MSYERNENVFPCWDRWVFEALKNIFRGIKRQIGEKVKSSAMQVLQELLEDRPKFQEMETPLGECSSHTLPYTREYNGNMVFC